MRVALPMLTLVPGLSGGSETYARELCRALARVGRHDYETLVSTLAPDAGGGLPTAVATGYRASTTTSGRLRAMGAAALHPGALRERLTGADVVHYPLTVPVPPVERPTVLTLLDVQHLDRPELFPRGERLFRRLAYDRAARRADRVVVISEWVRHRVTERLGLDPDRVDAIHLGVDHERFTPDPGVGREPFLLYPARPWPHKNHGRLLEAFALLRAERPELRLVLTGVGHDSARLPPGVEAPGGVPQRELVALYRRAAALVFPSLYEGFGLPPVEAMACGCPVAASNEGSLPEVVGDAAVLFDPHDPAAIAAGVSDALGRSAELSALGVVRAARFTWDATARAHDRVYELAAGA
ncbi:MAG TPA: glycosyltransferase family 1 protein [Gaiella sp.]|uniref:glycosyltransferase family 4 protein n=1 Tax=Gaiella sp. TaxID=2663207 RepID=UPI002D807C0B|nr:glycosyltransferase family 1 protein [Gaiella sp.]HET9287435.1 glycosyltransferase family 1 protein [Gaiella sp.]